MPSTFPYDGQLVFFLFLLIPGYFAVKAYFWANIEIDSTSRLNRLVLMAIGGFASLVFVSLFRNLASGTILQRLLSSVVPSFLEIKGNLTIATVASLSIVQAGNLIVSQSLAGIIGGYIYGSLKYLVLDQTDAHPKDLDQPWDEITGQMSTGDGVTVITRKGERIKGIIEQIGSPSKNYDLLIADPRETAVGMRTSDSSINDVDLAYIHHDDISRLYLHEERAGPERNWAMRKHMKILQKLTDIGEWLSLKERDFTFRSNRESDESDVVVRKYEREEGSTFTIRIEKSKIEDNKKDDEEN